MTNSISMLTLESGLLDKRGGFGKFSSNTKFASDFAYDYLKSFGENEDEQFDLLDEDGFCDDSRKSWQQAYQQDQECLFNDKNYNQRIEYDMLKDHYLYDSDNDGEFDIEKSFDRLHFNLKSFSMEGPLGNEIYTKDDGALLLCDGFNLISYEDDDMSLFDFPYAPFKDSFSFTCKDDYLYGTIKYNIFGNATKIDE